jgi:hypothetical protein
MHKHAQQSSNIRAWPAVQLAVFILSSVVVPVLLPTEQAATSSPVVAGDRHGNLSGEPAPIRLARGDRQRGLPIHCDIVLAEIR